MSEIVSITTEEIQSVYADSYGEELTPEQLAKIADELSGRVNNFIDELLKDILSDVFHA